MIRSNIKIAWRNLVKNKFTAVLNIGGLAAGIAVTLMLGLWIMDELSFNQSFSNYDRVAQVMVRHNDIGGPDVNKSMPIALGLELRRNYRDDFKRVVMATRTESHILSSKENKFTRSGRYMQPEAPELFSLTMLKGSRSALTDPHAVLLSATVAVTLFGRENPVNKIVKIDNIQLVRVAGVYKDLPRNSELYDMGFMLPWDLLVSSSGWYERRQTDWNDNFLVIYTELAAGRNMELAAAHIKNTKFDHLTKEQQRKDAPVVFLQPMRNWHLFNKFQHGVRVTSPQLQFVWLYGIIAGFVLLLACINFMNLSTARSEKRAREVGVRKAMGSLRRQLVIQFYTESVVIAGFAMGLSLAIALLLLPWFNGVADKDIHIPWSSPLFWASLLGVTFFTGLLAGSYPALYLSSFNAVKVLKGSFRAGPAASVPRKVLVVLQFTVSVTLIIGVLTVYRQILFSKNRPLGYNSSGLVYLDMPTDDIHRHFDAFRSDLLQTGAVLNAAESNGTINELWSNNGGFNWPGKDPHAADKIYFGTIGVSPEFGKTAGWIFISGRDFNRETVLSDSSAFVINEAAARYMGLTNPVGQTIQRDGKNYQIIGVIKDVLMESPYQPVTPTVFFLGTWAHATVSIRVNDSKGMATTLARIQTVFNKYAPSVPFEYRFADTEYAKKFAVEDRTATLAGFFAGLAILISCLGLFGLASFVAEQRAREVSIRKVLGASVVNLWGLLSKEFLVLVLIAFLLAVPLSWYWLQQWLQQFEFRANLSWWIFAGAALAVILVTLLTVSFQAIKAALANPVKSLHSQ